MYSKNFRESTFKKNIKHSYVVIIKGYYNILCNRNYITNCLEKKYLY